MSTGTQTKRPRFRNLGRKNGLVGSVVAEIEKQIVSGRLAVGTRLPPEREFAEDLGVSRTVVREAVRILMTNGLLDTRHGVGTTVRAVTKEQVVRPLNLFLRTQGAAITIEQLHQVRSVLEVENAGLAASHGSAEDVASLERAYAEMESCAGDPRQFAVRDSAFHRCLAEATHNPLLTVLLDSMQDLMAEVRSFVADDRNLYERVMPSHSQILRRIRERDAEGARSAMREHLALAMQIQKEHFDQQRS